MAKFEIAERITGRNEGGYANDPDDTGGETYAGISRNNWPNWSGWNNIDQIKKDIAANNQNVTAARINAAAVQSKSLLLLISVFYKRAFWDTNKLDLVDDQQLANSVYDFGVNSGTNRAAKYLQSVAKTTQDGIIGKTTLAAVNSLDTEEALTEYNKLRGNFYRSIARGNQAKFLPSWLSRLKPYVAMLIILLTTTLLSCGVRNVQANKEKVSVEKKDEIKINVDSSKTVAKEKESVSTESKEVEADIDNKTTETKTTETFNPDGSVKKRTTSTKTSAKTDKTKTKQTAAVTTKEKELSEFENHSELSELNEGDSTSTSNNKITNADKSFATNVGGWGVVIAVVSIITVSLFAYLFFRNRAKKKIDPVDKVDFM